MSLSKHIEIACIGEVMIELIASNENAQPAIGVGGDSFNTAAYLSGLAKQDNATVTYVTALGTERYSDMILSEIARHGVKTDFVERRENNLPGLYAIDTDDRGERSFTYWRGQSAARTLFQEPCNIQLQSLSKFDLIYISGISIAILSEDTRAAMIGFLKEYRKAGGKLAFDSNYRRRLWDDVKTAQDVTMAMWEITDIALPSLDDEMLLFDEDQAAIVARLENAGISFGALKRGVDGPVAFGTQVDSAINCESFPKVTNVVDTTAAGDSFNAGFIHKHTMGGSIVEAMRAGHNLASKVVQTKGAIISLED